MNLDFFYVAGNLISLFALAAVGYISIRSGILDAQAVPILSTLLMKITLPCTIFISLVQREYDPAFIHDGVIVIIAGVFTYAAMLYSARGVAHVLKVPKECRGIWAFVCSFNNAGFMGFPIALALFGAEGLAFSVMLNVSLNITMFTIGAMEICRDNPDKKSGGLNAKSIIFSSVNLATVLSMICYFYSLNIPDVIKTPLTFMSNITTPLSMMIIGMALARNKNIDLLDKNVWTSAAMRLLVFPTVISFVLKFVHLGNNPIAGAVFVVMMAMPVASIATALTEMYHGNMTFTSKVMFVHNVLCILTIPFVCIMLV